MHEKEIKHELEKLRNENQQLKAELSELKLARNNDTGTVDVEASELEKELQVQRHQLENMFSLANISTWSYDFVKDKLNPSKQILAIWTPPLRNIREAFLERIHPEDRAGMREALQNPEQASTHDYQYRIQGDDGNTYYMLCRCMVETDENGNPLRAHGLTWDITEKKLHEKQTMQTESHLRSFFEKIGLGAWEYSVNSKTTYLVKSIRRFMGINIDSSMVKHEEFESRIHFEDFERVKLEFLNVLSGKSPVFNCMFRMQRSSGEYVWMLSRGVPVFDNKAQVHKIIGSMEDLNQSKRYNSIKARFNFMQNIADALPIPVYYKDLHGRYIGFNEAFKEFVIKVTKTPPLIGATVRDLHKIYDREAGIELEQDEKAFIKNPSENFEKTYTLNYSPGKKLFIVNKKSILYDEDDKPRYLVGGIFDITAIKKTEERLQQTSERLNATLDAMSEMIMCFDNNLTLLWANRAARIALGGENKRFSGRKWRTIWSGGENLDLQNAPVYKVLTQNEEFSTGKVRTKDGRIFEIRAYPLLSRGRKVTGVLEMSMDITEHEVIKKRSEIHKEQLMLADKMKSLGILISGVAHEINNPNNSISINISLLKKMWEDLKPLFYSHLEKTPDFKLGNIPGSKLEKSMDDLLLGIKDGSSRIGCIIDSLKAYIRNVPANCTEVFDIHNAVDNAIFLLKNQIVKSTSKFSVEHCDAALPVDGVQQKIEQVIINVLQNACQALTSREESIKIESIADTSTRQVLVRISDTGCGISTENLNYITDPFFTTKREIGGTGLGLSISSSILEEHKGYFKFFSQPGQGTIVEIILPLANENGSG